MDNIWISDPKKNEGNKKVFTLIFWAFFRLFKKKSRNTQDGYFCACNNELVILDEICESCGNDLITVV